jgi:CRP/FNR family transcriptional regulator
MCFHRRNCLPAVVGEHASVVLRQVLGAPQRVAKGTRLVQAGKAASHVFIVHNGAFKSLVGVADGRQRIVGFHEAGDWLGLEGLSGVHRADVVALEHSQVCEVDLHGLEELAARIPSLQRHLCRAMAQALVHAQGQQFALGSMHVRERLVRFLLDIAQRASLRGFAADEFTLRMSREDIGDYLGFRLETVSRVFTELHRAGLIELARRRVRIRDRQALAELLDAAGAAAHAGATPLAQAPVASSSQPGVRGALLRLPRRAQQVDPALLAS